MFIVFLPYAQIFEIDTQKNLLFNLNQLANLNAHLRSPLKRILRKILYFLRMMISFICYPKSLMFATMIQKIITLNQIQKTQSRLSLKHKVKNLCLKPC